MLILSDVHGAFDRLAEVAGQGETLLILGDLVNLLDYRTREGIIADVLGTRFGGEVANHRARGDYVAMREAWGEVAGDRRDEIRAAIRQAVEAEYRLCQEALADAHGFCTYGNVDTPELLRAALPPTIRFVDGEVFEVEGLRIGFVGGGISTPMGAAGEVTDDQMTEKLDRIGPVEILCSHLPPQVDALHTDVITGRRERASKPILDYLLRHQPRHHFFGDVHQPQALTWRVGRTICHNVGYFRATGRPFRFEP